MHKQQTAIEWLMEQIQEQRENGDNDLRQTLYYCKQAKEMEKEQHEKTWIEAIDYGLRSIKGSINLNPVDALEKYFNETYKNK